MNKNTLLLAGLFVASPLLALPFIIYGIYHRDKACFMLFAAFMALIAFQTAPTGDLARHTMAYYAMKDMRPSEFLVFMSKSRDILFYSISYLFGLLGIPFGFVKAFILFVEGCIVNYIFNSTIAASRYPYTRQQIFLRYVIVFLSFNWFSAIIGLRYTLGVCLYLMAVHCWLDRRSLILTIVFSILTILTHFSFLYFIALSILFLCIPLKRSVSFLPIVIALAAAPLVMDIFTDYFLEEELAGSSYLSGGQWGSGYTEYVSTNMIIFLWISHLCALPFVYLLLTRYTSENSYARLCLLYLCLFLCVYDLLTLSGRIQRLFLTLSPLFLLAYERRYQCLTSKYIRIIVFCMGAFFVSQIYARRTTMKLSHYERMFLPVPITLDDTFNESWIRRNIMI